MLQSITSFFKKNKNLVLMLILAGFLVYANALPNQLFWDDDDGIIKNVYLRDWQNFENFFRENLIAGAGLNSNYWRPLLLITYSIEWHLWQDWTPGYHFTNILIHLAAGIALFYLLLKLFKNQAIAFFTALIFLIHPLQTEAVTYVSGRADPLSTLLIFLGLIFYLRSKEPLNSITDQKIRKSQNQAQVKTLSQTKHKPKAWPIILCFVLSLMTKEKSVMIFPGLLLLIDLYLYLKQEPDPALKKSARKTNADQSIHSGKSLSPTRSLSRFLLTELKNLYPYLLIGGFYSLLRATVLNFQNTFNLYNEANPYTESILVRIFTFLKILPEYLFISFAPQNLHMERLVDFQTKFFDPWVLAGLFIVILLLIMAYKLRRKNPDYTFAILWFFGTLFPASGILFAMSGLMYEHYLYFPLVGLTLLVIFLIHDGLIARWANQSNSQLDAKTKVGANPKTQNQLKTPWPKFLFYILVAGYLLFLSLTTIYQNSIWRDPIRFYNHVLKYNTTSLRVYNNLGMAYSDNHQYPEAIAAYEKAIKLDLNNQSAPPRHNLGNIYEELDELDKAAANYEQAIQIDEKFLFSYPRLINIYLEQHNYAKALLILEKAREQFPENREFKQLYYEVKKQIK